MAAKRLRRPSAQWMTISLSLSRKTPMAAGEGLGRDAAAVSMAGSAVRLRGVIEGAGRSLSITRPGLSSDSPVGGWAGAALALPHFAPPPPPPCQRRALT